MRAYEFLNGLKDWLQKYKFDNVFDIKFDECSCYAIQQHCITIGIMRSDAIEDALFEEFLIENGMEANGFPPVVLQFLHELGHSQTIHIFSDDELKYFRFIKHMTSYTEDTKKFIKTYWAIDDELAANKWAINFINTSCDAVIELCQFFIDNWNSMIKEAKILSIQDKVIEKARTNI